MINNNNAFRNGNLPPGAGHVTTYEAEAMCDDAHVWTVDVHEELGAEMITPELCPHCGKPGFIERDTYNG